MSSGQELCGTYSPKVTSTQKLSALASNKHYLVRKRCFGEGERERERDWQTEEEGQRSPPNGSVLCAGIVKLNQESHFELT